MTAVPVFSPGLNHLKALASARGPELAPLARLVEAQVVSVSASTDVVVARSGDEGEGFFDALLDVVNPLHHIPVVGDLYREFTGDRISAVSRVAGGALFGGPVGAAAAALNATLQWMTGRDAGEHMIAFVKDLTGATLAANAEAPSETTAAATESTEKDAVPAAMLSRAPIAETVADVAAEAASHDAPKQAGTAASAVMTDPALALAADPKAWFADRMLQALDKYRALHRRDEAPAALPGDMVDSLL